MNTTTHSPSVFPRPGLLVRLLFALIASLAFTGIAWAGPALSPDLKPGQYEWVPEASPDGPVVIIVSIPEQLVHVYRGGVRIGWSTTTTGKPGHETPTGVFPILQKRVEHYSNLYNNAPMPYMQRLTWDGVALHAGRIRARPASHGCVRLPDAFASRLFDITTTGDTVIVAGDIDSPELVMPGDTLPVAAIAQLGADLDPADLRVRSAQATPPAPGAGTPRVGAGATVATAE